jgi:hypothetical protein
VTILQATAELDAGPIWASHEVVRETDPPSKIRLYRGQVTDTAVRGRRWETVALVCSTRSSLGSATASCREAGVFRDAHVAHPKASSPRAIGGGS